MKRFLIILLAIYPIFLFGQQNEMNFELPLYKMDLPVDEETGLITFVYVFKAENSTKEGLYYKALDWFTEKYNAVDQVLWINDKENGELFGKPFTDIMILEAGMGEMEKMYYTIRIYLKEGRYKCVVTDIQYQSYPSEFDQFPDRYAAESIIISELYKKKGKVRSTNLQYKEKTISSVRSLVMDLQQAMNSISVTANSDDW